MPDSPDESRSTPEQNASPAQKVEGTAGPVASGLGCLTFATLPFSILALVALILLIAWIVHRMLTTYTP
jgi:hypothetical protein